MLRTPSTPAANAAVRNAARPSPSGAVQSIVTFQTYRPSDQPVEGAAWRRHPLTWGDAVAAAAFLALALVFRAPFILQGETLLHSDEAIVGLMAQDIAAGERFPIYFYGQRYMGALEAYAIAAVSPLFSNPIHALRFGPACFFAVMVALQYLMLTRWFGRRGGFFGATALVCAAPMMVQWSVSARGGYVEILLWGTMLLWAYSEWFVTPEPARRRGLHKALFGAIVGSGMWINPSIVLFLLPVVVHALFDRPLGLAWDAPVIGPQVRRVSERLGRVALPVCLLAGVLLLNATWSVWVEDHKVRSELLLGLVPAPVAGMVIAAGMAAAAFVAQRRFGWLAHVRHVISQQAALVLGLCIGALPIFIYVIGRTLGPRPLDPSLPLGFRPLWRTGETMNYLWNGLPLLFTPDPRPFVRLVSVGRDTVAAPLSFLSAGITHCEAMLAAGAITTCLVIFLIGQRGEIGRALRLRPFHHGPQMLLLFGAVGAIGLYVMGGCTLDFTTIRYLVPLWVFVPGLLAVVFLDGRFPTASKVAPLALCGAWLIGQCALFSQIGAPHPLRAVADELERRDVRVAVAEPLDAHLLSYLTGQSCRTIEFESFWPRLAHYYGEYRPDRPMTYLVQTSEVDRTWDWIRGGWPGAPPPETHRFLWPRLRRVLHTQPELVESREKLPDGYELIRLRRPLPDRSIEKARRLGTSRQGG